jgi:hypothetical protein
MEIQRFASPLQSRILQMVLYAATACIGVAPIMIIWMLSGFKSLDHAVEQAISMPSLFLPFVGFLLLLLFIKAGNSALRYPVTANEIEITQVPLFGGARRIRWADVDRIQVLDGVGYRGMRAYRIRVFSKVCVITFTKDFADTNKLVGFLQKKAETYNIPIYQEDSVGVNRLVFGSWSIDSSGKSAGVPLTRVEAIPLP